MTLKLLFQLIYSNVLIFFVFGLRSKNKKMTVFLESIIDVSFEGNSVVISLLMIINCLA